MKVNSKIIQSVKPTEVLSKDTKFEKNTDVNTEKLFRVIDYPTGKVVYEYSSGKDSEFNKYFKKNTNGKGFDGIKPKYS